MEYITLRNGVQMPKLGIGTLAVKDLTLCEDTIVKAIEHGYRLIDTAQSYGNEEAVGKAIKRSSISRENLFITTKLKIENCTYDRAKEAFFESLNRLQMDYVDLLLIHHPYNDTYGTWRAMTELYKDGYVRAIGICNFVPDRLEDFIIHNEEKPQLMQFEMHPFNAQSLTRNILKENHIAAEAHSPFAQGKYNMFSNPRLVKIAQAHNKTVGQVILRWFMQNNVIAIPKTTHEERMDENMDIFDFELSTEEMEYIAYLDAGVSATPQMRAPFWTDNMSSF